MTSLGEGGNMFSIKVTIKAIIKIIYQGIWPKIRIILLKLKKFNTSAI
jgi:hypothetical protein